MFDMEDFWLLLQKGKLIVLLFCLLMTWKKKFFLSGSFLLPLSLSVIWKILTKGRVWHLPHDLPLTTTGLGSPSHTAAPTSPKHFPAFTAPQTCRPVAERMPTKRRDTSDAVPIASACTFLANTMPAVVMYISCFVGSLAVPPLLSSHQTFIQPQRISISRQQPLAKSARTRRSPSVPLSPPRLRFISSSGSPPPPPRAHPPSCSNPLLSKSLFCLFNFFSSALSFPAHYSFLLQLFGKDRKKGVGRGELKTAAAASIPLMFWGNAGSFGRRRGNARR